MLIVISAIIGVISAVTGCTLLTIGLIKEKDGLMWIGIAAYLVAVACITVMCIAMIISR
jgi:hypothetical protein